MDKNEALIQEVYKNTKMGGDSIIDLIDRANDPKFRSEMTSELESYRHYSEEASRRLQERGLKPTELTATAKMGAKLGMAFNTLLDTTTSHLAELMINGATMGIIDLEKRLNSGTYSSDAKHLAEDVLKFEKSTVARLGEFL